MATRSKNNKKTKKKATSQFKTVTSIQKLTDEWMEAVKSKNERYVVKPFEKGKAFVDDVRDDPVRVVERLVKDGKAFGRDLSEDPRKVLGGFFDNGKELMSNARKNMRESLEGFVENGKELYDGLRTDGRKLVDDLAENSKELMARIPDMKRMEEGFAGVVQFIPKQLDLPKRDEIESLTKTLRSLNRRVNALSRQPGA